MAKSLDNPDAVRSVCRWDRQAARSEHSARLEVTVAFIGPRKALDIHIGLAVNLHNCSIHRTSIHHQRFFSRGACANASRTRQNHEPAPPEIEDTSTRP